MTNPYDPAAQQPNGNTPEPASNQPPVHIDPQNLSNGTPPLVTGAPGMGKNFHANPFTADSQQSNQSPPPHNPYLQAPQGHNAQGYPQQSFASDFVRRDKSVVAALLLWFFFGALGVHRFYLDSTKFGLIILGATIASVVLSVVGIGFLIVPLISLFLIFDIFWILARTGQIQSREFEDFAKKLV